MTDQELKDLVASLTEGTKAIQESQLKTEEQFKQIAEQSKKTDEQFRKTDEQFRQTAEQFRKTDEQFRQTAEQFRKTDEQFRQTAEQFRKTDEQFRQTDEQFRKIDEEFRKTEEQMRRNDEKLARMGIHLGNISNNQGDVAEEFFYNSLDDKKTLAGIKYDFVDKNWAGREGSVRDEYDIVMVNGKDIAIVEVKYKAHERDLEKLITKKYENFKILYPTYKDYNHHLALASFHINEELKEEALRKGVIVLQRKGDMVETFEPCV